MNIDTVDLSTTNIILCVIILFHVAVGYVPVAIVCLMSFVATIVRGCSCCCWMADASDCPITIPACGWPLIVIVRFGCRVIYWNRWRECRETREDERMDGKSWNTGTSSGKLPVASERFAAVAVCELVSAEIVEAANVFVVVAVAAGPAAVV